ncbi:FKBP-type peptidyl-prolyl cis-trans isomerase [Rhodopirellula sp. MGV]|uniref:FKBP-type peptidyl-prolyl cis-trans isomerase n=1 Tax=Rhodopirellula sp. MGV TaxID=2023130 RepID=UPI000B96D4E8|nr:FKBP-type peptidyl-prolyl cis-trans isomerase [Rhodopirellula sp. MGV]OYP34001.1 peptidylprolyl isomerase [Rhodopirellula sp. MGV]PNY34119.1 peptidylprolyl isomerase [Rhodopirellula baltica]
MKPPLSLKIVNLSIGSGRHCVPGDVAVCHCVCLLHQGDQLFASEASQPYQIRVGARNSFAGIEYGLLGMKIGGHRKIIVPPNLAYGERKAFPELSEKSLLVYQIKLTDLPAKWDPEMDRRLSERTNP